MRFLYFLADHVFRFRYRDPMIDNQEDSLLMTWDLGVYEEEVDKMLRDFLIMGITLGVTITTILAGLLWLIVR